MRVRVGDIRRLVNQHVVEGKVSASADYLRIERLRQAIQNEVTAMVASGDIATDSQLREIFSKVDMVANTLKDIPLDVWRKLAGAQKPAR